MRIDVVTLFPEMVASLTGFGIPARATEKKLLQLQCWNPRDYTHDRHRTVDDRPYGGGPGMVMKVEPLRAAIQDARQQVEAATGRRPRVVYLSPQGRTLDQQSVQALAQQQLILVAGRYEGIDERLIQLEVDEEWSIGDYVLSGGELAAMVMIDAMTRMIPGALGDEDSAQQDSFMEGLLDCPHYTRPEVYEGMQVPEVLLGGNHQAIAEWRHKQAIGRTWQRRPDLLDRLELSEQQKNLLQEYIQETEASTKK